MKQSDVWKFLWDPKAVVDATDEILDFEDFNFIDLETFNFIYFRFTNVLSSMECFLGF